MVVPENGNNKLVADEAGLNVYISPEEMAVLLSDGKETITSEEAELKEDAELKTAPLPSPATVPLQSRVEELEAKLNALEGKFTALKTSMALLLTQMDQEIPPLSAEVRSYMCELELFMVMEKLHQQAIALFGSEYLRQAYVWWR